MRDKRPVDELSIEELERVLAIRKREQRMQRMERMRQAGRVVESPAASPSETLPSSRSVGAEGATGLPVQQPISAVAPARPMANPALKPKPEGQAGETSPRFEEDPFADPRFEDPEAAAQRRTVFNRLLLGVEVAAVVGLLFIGVNMALSINALERETQAAQEVANQSRLAGIPTMAPTSILSVRIEDYVLPGGHVVEADDSVRFNLDEFIEDVPAHLRVAVQQQVFPVDIVRPPETLETALYVSIPRLGIEQTIVQGTDWEALRSGIGQVLNGAFPSASSGNVVLAAHNDIYAQLFKDLDTMQVGDVFYIQDSNSDLHVPGNGDGHRQPN
ncbi:MAG: sortase [Chloroflexi bacterium]|nr:sortase [Chloroflexota bacterium]